jgi:hypothetical protein
VTANTLCQAGVNRPVISRDSAITAFLFRKMLSLWEGDVNKTIRFGFALLLGACAYMAQAQNTNSADVRGTATDASGAILPGVTVTLTDVTKSVVHTYVTDGAGLYDTGPVVPDQYTVTFTKDGFNTLVRGPVTLNVGTSTVNGELSVGAVTQRIVVKTDVPLLETETGAQSTTIPEQALAQLPIVSANWEDFIILTPGARGVQGPNSSSLNPQSNASINGNMPYNSILSDGANILLFYSLNSSQNIYDSIAEIQTQTSSFSAQYGMGGVIFNQISKGGSNTFHGQVYEYFQNDALNASPYAFGAKTTVPLLRYNHFGGNIGGPIPFSVLKNRAFFFFDYDKLLENTASIGFLTVPTAAMRSGDFTGQPTIYDPATQTVDSAGVLHRQSFASEYANGNKIPSAMVDSVSNALQGYFPQPNIAGTVVNGVTTNNYFYNIASKTPATGYFGRLDYDITPSNRFTASETNFTTHSNNQNIGACPIDCYPSSDQNDNAQVTDVWSIRPDTINEARMGFTDQLDYYTPETYGAGIPAKVGWKFSKADIFPYININGACCFNGAMQPGPTAVYREMTYDPSDVVTLIRGRHVLKFGGELLMMQCNCTTWNNVNGGSLTYTGAYTASSQGTTNTTGVAYADYLLGYTQSWSASVAPPFHARLKNPQIFAEDSFKVRPNLTLNLGLRWQGTTGITDTAGDMYSFDPTVQNPATQTLGAMWYGTTKANGRTNLQHPVWSTFLPRLGFSYQVRPNLVVRGGFGLFSYGWSHDANGQGDGSAFSSSGNYSDSSNGVKPVVLFSSDGNTNYQGGTGSSINAKYVLPTTNPAAFNGQAAPYNQYHTPVTKVYQWNLEVQRELGSNLVAKIGYIGSYGYNLSFPVDINQVPEDKLGPQDNPSARPYPQFQGLSGSTNNALSNYNALQATVDKRLTSGLAFSVNYTWSHMMSDQDSAGWGQRGGNAPYQNAYVPSDNYGPSNFDIRNMLKGQVMYALPFGQGQRFLNGNRLMDTAIGGWHTSATLLAQGGNPFTVVMQNDTSYSQGSGASQFPNVVGNPLSGTPHNIHQWFNTAAFAAPAASTFGDSRRNSIYGPGLTNINFSLGKSFHIWREAVMEFRGEATNVINHPSFGTPDPDIGPGHTAQITTVSVKGRTMQLVGKLNF